MKYRDATYDYAIASNLDDIKQVNLISKKNEIKNKRKLFMSYFNSSYLTPQAKTNNQSMRVSQSPRTIRELKMSNPLNEVPRESILPSMQTPTKKMMLAEKPKKIMDHYRYAMTKDKIKKELKDFGDPYNKNNIKKRLQEFGLTSYDIKKMRKSTNTSIIVLNQNAKQLEKDNSFENKKFANKNHNKSIQNNNSQSPSYSFRKNDLAGTTGYLDRAIRIANTMD